ncbi:transporter substrate-binding domain-containing protein [Rahnella sp. C60]|jgi:polar amino acid transport system substrate-binding protein|uniref:Transporter substrate-binding domain-containing protein n=1 Tax=Rahnella perminowiae TaxID=2816244 RepID=A0ABS6KYK9_9GAMM|nr:MULTISPECIES: transporter substrate-binding domain-containing protein [Rahnella]UJD92453.1 transporter substrate-binding domain-containing protein [Rahnella aquatilis]MBU9809894.1 transporter substrate-binding domain-containing protein [Rahnella perminowiae]MBU9815662.1 transporter substrate-binding domain-containing protein [Rahnella perminowiae]MBU9824546.1 transporter substrate-binding domain-containing protein [Rahnella perminowiae]MBU9834699.1 transporter substrate-binding domain-conta
MNAISLKIIAGTLVMLAVAGCTPTEEKKEAGAAPQSALQTVLQRGTLRVGDCLSFAPFGFYDKDGNPDGYDVDLAKALAKEMGVKLEMVNTTSANRIPNLQTNKVDVVFCNFTRNLERAKEIGFTNPYVVASEAMLVRKESGIKSAHDMAGKTIATVKGSTNGDEVRSMGIDVKIQEYDSSQAAILAVKQGQADAMIEDNNFLAYQAKLDPTLAVTNEALVPLEYNAFGVKQGDQAWLNYLNEFLFEINASGENARLYQKWFGDKPRYPLNPQF